MLDLSLLLGFGALLLVALTLLVLPLGKQRLIRYKYPVMLGLCLFTLSTVGLYRHYGALEGLKHLAAYHDIDDFFAEFVQNKDQTKEQVIGNLAQVEQKIAHSHAALARLGGVYNELGLSEAAIGCFEKAREMAPGIVDYHVQWIYSYSLWNQGQLPPQMRLNAEAIWAEHPQQFVLINLLAIDAYFKQDFANAIQYWQRLIDFDQSLNNERKLVLQNAINKAKLSLPEGKVPEIIVKVDVSLAKGLAPRVQPSDVVFIFVKAPNQNMPLAVLKRTAGELPFTVELTNKQQMMPGRSMKAGEKVEVIAKITASGDPLTKEGALRGEIQEMVVNYGINSVNIEINQS